MRKTAATGTTTRYLWDGDDLVMELELGNDILREYSYYPGIDRPHAVRIPAEQDRIYYYLPELPGHVAGLTSEDYRVANVYRYTPFGEPIETGLAEWATQSLGFGAREWDGESGMYYVRARYYDPELGRFISEDPIILEGGINVFSFADADPVNKTDPSGLQACGTRVPSRVQQGIHVQPCDDRWGRGPYIFTPGRGSRGPSNGLFNGGIFAPSTEGGLFGAGGRTGEMAEERVLACAVDHYGPVSVPARTATIALLPTAIPLSKRRIGERVVGTATEATNLISHYGLTRFRGLKVPFGIKILGTNRVFGVLGRAASGLVPFVGGAQLGYDALEIGACVSE